MCLHDVLHERIHHDAPQSPRDIYWQGCFTFCVLDARLQKSQGRDRTWYAMLN